MAEATGHGLWPGDRVVWHRIQKVRKSGVVEEQYIPATLVMVNAKAKIRLDDGGFRNVEIKSLTRVTR